MCNTLSIYSTEIPFSFALLDMTAYIMWEIILSGSKTLLLRTLQQQQEPVGILHCQHLSMLMAISWQNYLVSKILHRWITLTLANYRFKTIYTKYPRVTKIT